MLKALEGGGGLEQLAAAHQPVAAFHGDNYLPLLEGFYRSRLACVRNGRICAWARAPSVR